MATINLLGRKVPITVFGFDVDGVLRDTGYQAFINCQLAVAELGGIPPEFDDFVHDWGGLLIEYYRKCGVTASDDEIRKVNLARIAEHDLVAPFEDVAETLEHLKLSGLRMFALSGHETDKLQAWFTMHELHPRFSHIRGDGREKINHLIDLCKQMDVDPSGVCYVGDWGQDMRAAKEVGLIPIGLMRSHSTKDTLLRNGASLVIDHLSELTMLVS
jgi:phosphoglycolate phosphatase-like HAD superfamily hydrolase